MLRTDTAVTIYRKDYAAPAFRIDEVALEIDLVPERTRVVNRLRMTRTAAAKPLVLVGEGLELAGATLDGQALQGLQANGDTLTIDAVPAEVGASFTLELTTFCNPAANSSLMGLYVSNGNFFTQCEAEGFRKITYFLDRPDVMTVYTVTLRASKADYPVLLSNGNLVSERDLPDGRHEAVWHDPFKKPSYLFALVAGKLECIEERIQSASGKEKLLQVWVEPQDLGKTRHAMDSLIHSVRWDERRFGLELDLDRFMIVAVGDFNMGAMENKGLNIFNTKYVLANAETATDVDFANIESVVGHEYFHNWTGNRVTCRDWFQLSLKEGLTVFRDQEFSADMAAQSGNEAAAASARAVKRIEDVRMLRQVQFPEDAGPMAHPVRPDSYEEINNFYTVTVYEKGAEVVRMYQTLLGRDGFRKGMDLYFQRHDGHAVTCDDFRAAMADANGRDLTQFGRWYSQAGTPVVTVEGRHDTAARTYTLTLRQRCEPVGIETTSGIQKQPFHIPFAVGLIDKQGRDLPLCLRGETASPSPVTTRVLDFTEAEQTFVFEDVADAPLPSLLRNFSAPVIVEYGYTTEQLTFQLAHDSDPFNRWEAGQRLATDTLLRMVADIQQGRAPVVDPALVEALRAVLADAALDPAFRKQMLILPAESYLAERMAVADPAAIHTARRTLRRTLAEALNTELLHAYQDNQTEGAYTPDAVSAGKRALKNIALGYLVETETPEALALAEQQYARATNMTDRMGALSAMVTSYAPGREAALADFYTRFADDPLVIDKWFQVQARDPSETALGRVLGLTAHPEFDARNPNRLRALVLGFASMNPFRFHAEDGSGYRFLTDQIIAVDRINPNVAARLVEPMSGWARYAKPLADKMRGQLQRLFATEGLSRNVSELVGKALGD